MFINIPGISIVLVANAAERLALVPVDGTIVEQLDDNSVYAYNQPSNTWVPLGGGGGGGVSSVGLGLPASVFAVSGSPVTGSGTLTGSFITQAPNTFFAGPASGGSAVPTFRTLTAADFTVGGGANRVLFIDPTNTFIDNSASFTYNKTTTAFNLQSTNAGIGDTAGSGFGTKTVITDSNGRITNTALGRIINNTDVFLINDNAANSTFALSATGNVLVQFGDLGVAGNGTYVSFDDGVPEFLYDGPLFRVTGSGFSYNGVAYSMPASQGSASTVLTNDGSGNLTWVAAGGSGTVTSVGLSLPAIFSVSGSPVTGSGTLTGTLATQNANLVFAGPSTGSPAAPTFRSLVAADIPSLSSIYLPLAGGTMTGSLILAGAPTLALEAATKAYVDAGISGFSLKETVQAATITNITLSGPQTIDGHAVVAGERVLVTAQTSSIDNGIYVVAAGAWSRSADYAAASDAVGTLVPVLNGATYGSKILQQFQDPAIVGTDNLNYSIFSNNLYIADGQGIELTGGNTFTLELDGTTLSKSSAGLRLAVGSPNSIPFMDASGDLSSDTDKLFYDAATNSFIINDANINPQMSVDGVSRRIGLGDVGSNYGEMFVDLRATSFGAFGDFGFGVQNVFTVDVANQLISFGDSDGTMGGGGLVKLASPSFDEFTAEDALGRAFRTRISRKNTYFGDIDGGINSFVFAFEDSTQSLAVTTATRNVFLLDVLNETYSIGRLSGGTSTNFSITDNTSTYTFNRRNITVGAVAMVFPASAGTAGQVLSIASVGGGGELNLSWAAGGGGGITTVGTFNGAAPAANGATISGSDILFQSASATVPGMVDLATQTFTGLKAFVTGLEATAASITGTGGAGYLDFFNQSSNASLPSASFIRMYTATDRVIFSTSTVRNTFTFNSTADRAYTLPDVTGTFAIINPTGAATGDIYYRDAGGAFQRLGIGSAAQVLTVSSGLPSWQNSAAGFADPMTTIGDMIIRNGSNVTTRLGIGTANQFLSIVGGIPAWVAQPITALTGDVTASGSGSVAATVVSASDTVAGKVELATIAETNTGTDATRAVTPDGLAGSYAGTKNISLQAVDANTVLVFGNGVAYFRIPVELNGMNLVSVGCANFVASNGSSSTYQFSRGRQASPTSAHTFVSMLSTVVTIDDLEYDSKDATTPPVINTSNDDVLTGDLIRVDIVTEGVNTQGLFVTLGFRLP